MTTGNRGNIRTPGRTPPFILVGLLVLVGFLGYSYWSLSSAHRDLAAELDSLQIQKKDIDQRNSEAEKNLENAREELRSAQGNLDQARKQLQDREAEFASLKTDLSIKQADADKLQNQLSQCDTSLAEHRSSLEALKNEKGELNKLLFEEKQKTPVCSMDTCIIPIKTILAIVSKLAGSDAIGRALSDANLDANMLMEGIQDSKPDGQPLNAAQQQQGVNQQQQGVNQQQGQLQQPQGQVQQQPQGQVQHQPQGQVQQQPQGQVQQQQGQVQQQQVADPKPVNAE